MANRSTMGFFHAVAACSSDSVKMTTEPAGQAYNFHERVVGLQHFRGIGEAGLVRAREEEGAAVGLLDRVQLPDHAREPGVDAPPVGAVVDGPKSRAAMRALGSARFPAELTPSNERPFTAEVVVLLRARAAAQNFSLRTGTMAGWSSNSCAGPVKLLPPTGQMLFDRPALSLREDPGQQQPPLQVEEELLRSVICGVLWASVICGVPWARSRPSWAC